MNAYLSGWQNIFNISGRATRSEYWTFGILNSILITGIQIGFFGNAKAVLPITILMIAVFIASITISIRRLHDINKSGWWLLINAIPAIGQLVLLVFMLTPSKPVNTAPKTS